MSARGFRFQSLAVFSILMYRGQSRTGLERDLDQNAAEVEYNVTFFGASLRCA